MAGHLKLLVACSDPLTRRSLASALARHGVDPVCCSTVGAAQAFLRRHPVCLVFCESRLPDGTFRDLLRFAGHAQSGVPIVVTSRVEDTAEYLEAMELGAFDFLARPYRRAELDWILSKALAKTSATAA